MKAGLYEHLAQFSDHIKSVGGAHAVATSGRLGKTVRAAYERMALDWADLTCEATYNLRTSSPEFLAYVHSSAQFINPKQWR